MRRICTQCAEAELNASTKTVKPTKQTQTGEPASGIEPTIPGDANPSELIHKVLATKHTSSRIRVSSPGLHRTYLVCDI